MSNKLKKKKNPLVSIVMNVFNGEEYLRASISSILFQTYKNWELIFWDNNSKDNSKKIFFEFKDKRMKYFFSQKKINLYASRNLAIKKCRGDYIAFLDQDDLWLKDKLKKQMNLFSKDEKIALIYSNYYRLNSKKLFFKKKLLTKHNLPEGKITNFLLKNYVVGLCTIIFKRKLFPKKNIFNTKFYMLSDYIFVLNTSKKYIIRCLQEPLSIYRYHHNQMSNKYYSLSVRQHFKWLSNTKEIKKFYKYENFKFLVQKIKFMQIIDFINNDKRLYAIKKIVDYPLSIDKLKLFLKLILPKTLFSYLFGQLY